VAGGLAADSDSAMPMAQQQMIQNHWRTIEQKLGTSFNHDFWRDNTPRRSTYNACRAVIAAHKQSCQKTMINAIQQAYYLRALNPSDIDVLVSVAKELSEQTSSTLEVAQFITDINSSETNKELAKQVSLARKLTQQGFPSLVLDIDGVIQQVPLDYSDYKTTLAYIQKVS
jgi:putative protein-disulfide isomerase